MAEVTSCFSPEELAELNSLLDRLRISAESISRDETP
jgi:hypothetical protein